MASKLVMVEHYSLHATGRHPSQLGLLRAALPSHNSGVSASVSFSVSASAAAASSSLPPGFSPIAAAAVARDGFCPLTTRMLPARCQVHAVNIAGLQTCAKDDIYLIFRGGTNETMNKQFIGGNFNDVGLLQTLRICLAPEVTVTWAIRGRDYYVQFASIFDVDLYFNRSLGRKLGISSVVTPEQHEMDGLGETSGTSCGTSATLAVATHQHGYRVLLISGTVFRCTLPVNVLSNLHFLYLASKQSPDNGGGLEVITQITPARPIVDLRPTSLHRYPPVQQDFPRFFDLLSGMHLVLLDSDFQRLECFHEFAGHCQVILDMV
jgi:hypothetical protein